MIDDTTTEIRSHADGSIDYEYYAARASQARNGEFKRLVRENIATRASHGSLLSVLATLVLLAIIL